MNNHVRRLVKTIFLLDLFYSFYVIKSCLNCLILIQFPNFFNIMLFWVASRLKWIDSKLYDLGIIHLLLYYVSQEGGGVGVCVI